MGRLTRGPREFFSWLLRDPATGQVVLWQRPNKPLVIWLAATAARRLDPKPEWSQELEWVRTGALTVWAAGEMTRGVTPYRRLVGSVVMMNLFARLVR